VIFTRVAGFLGFLAVALGAFGAHALRTRLGPADLEIWRTAAFYHLVHAVALLAVSLAGGRGRAARVVCWLWIIGIVIFAGSLYLLAATGLGWLGAVTPFGGMAFLTGWLILAVTALKDR
jgi:uncharacterized membrane protein YgdD (TMEM256/DUF423 family)